jgi:hypothetical protein
MDYLRMRHHWNGAGLILHEFCHLIHQQVFGLDCERIMAIHVGARESKRYDNVLRRDWAGKEDGDTDLAYSMIDCKEFFAEMSVTFLANGYRKLDNASSCQMENCSPPITEPTVLERLRSSKTWSDLSSARSPFLLGWLRSFTNYFVEHEHHSHCNKFYPFTSGQLQFYDPYVYTEIKRLWFDIAHWDDRNDLEDNSCSFCWITLRKDNFTENSNQTIVFRDQEYVAPPIRVNDTVDL